MQAVMEKPALDDPTELAATTVEAVTDFLKTTTPPTPPLAPAQPEVTDEKLTFTKEYWITGKAANKQLAALMWADAVSVPTSTDECLQAATQWCAPPKFPSILPGEMTGVPGNGLADTPAKLNTSGLITTTEIADFLDWCALRIERRGWVQHTLNYQERVCAMGAIQARFHGAKDQMAENRAYALSQTAARHLRYYLGEPIESWNDAPGRTMGEVIALFRKTAASLLAQVDPSMHPGDLRQPFPDVLLAA